MKSRYGNMSASARATQHAVFSVHDYVLLERDSSVKHEYFDGQIRAMSGGTPEHARLSAVISRILDAALDGSRCTVYSSDLRVCVRKTGLRTYPDVTVVCGPLESDPEDENGATNPIVIVEVASKSTEKYDRGEKLDNYKQIRSLKEYVLVSQRERAIEVFRRTSGGWTNHMARSGDQIVLSSVGVTLDVDTVYRSATIVRVTKKSGDRRRRSSRNLG